jgi:flagellar hook-basal body complex protein FliE
MKDMAIQGVAGSVGHLSQPGKKAPGEHSGDFQSMLLNSIKEVNKMQLDSNNAIHQLATGTTESIHETMIAMEKASVSFQMMMQIRNRIIDAYQEILNKSM